MTDVLDKWPDEIFTTLKALDVRHVAYVPDAGHTKLINLAIAERTMAATVLTTEEEGIGYLAGAWLGGERGVLLMQSSGVGNCINMLSLTMSCRFPLLMLVTMRGEWAEFNPWQQPMSNATAPSLELMGVQTRHVEEPADVAPMVSALGEQVFAGDLAGAVLLGQKLVGKKEWIR